jgi:hypothetical protein
MKLSIFLHCPRHKNLSMANQYRSIGGQTQLVEAATRLGRVNARPGAPLYEMCIKVREENQEPTLFVSTISSQPFVE